MLPTVLNFPSTAATGVGSSILTLLRTYNSASSLQLHTFHLKFPNSKTKSTTFPSLSCYSDSNPSPAENLSPPETAVQTISPPIVKKKKRYRKRYPGEKKGISEEMRFLAMRLRSTKKTTRIAERESENEIKADESISMAAGDGGGVSSSGETWEPSVEGFVNYLVNSKLVFDTLERIVDDSSDVSYVYFRNTGLERSESLSKDLEWFRQQDVLIPEPSKPGISYAKYLKELSETKPPFFLSHFYNIYFSHIAGGQVITNEVSKRIFEGQKLEFCRWQGNEQELLRGVRENLNMLGENWSRNEKSKCLVEARKAFRYLGQIVRLIIA